MDKSENCSRYRDCAENWENYFCLYLVLDPLSRGSRGSNREMKPPLTLHHARLCGPVDIIRSLGQTSSSLSNVLPSHWATLSPVTHPGLDKWPSSLPAPPAPPPSYPLSLQTKLQWPTFTIRPVRSVTDHAAAGLTLLVNKTIAVSIMMSLISQASSYHRPLSH